MGRWFYELKMCADVCAIGLSKGRRGVRFENKKLEGGGAAAGNFLKFYRVAKGSRDVFRSQYNKLQT